MRKTYIIIILCTVIACLASCAGKTNPDTAASLPEKQMRYLESKTDKVTYFPYQNILDQYGEPASFCTAGNGEACFLYHYGEESDAHSGVEGDAVSNLVVKYDARSGTCGELVLESDGILYGSIHMSPEGTLILPVAWFFRNQASWCARPMWPLTISVLTWPRDRRQGKPILTGISVRGRDAVSYLSWTVRGLHSAGDGSGDL